MAKKSFIGGLDNLLASAGVKKRDVEQKQLSDSVKDSEKEAMTDAEKEIQELSERVERLNQELFLWRTQKLTSPLFLSTLKEAGLQYLPETNEIVEL
ncbi:MAG: hypothetical protein CSB06_00925 [Bacteroidia bacterium]|nr:MAG: hypothetical protein CSB06_00925 [Bacteroidia bacterium]